MIFTPHDHQRVPGVFEGVGRSVDFSAFVVPLFQQAMTADPVGLVLDDAQCSLPREDGELIRRGDLDPSGLGQGEDGSGQGMGAVGFKSCCAGEDLFF